MIIETLEVVFLFTTTLIIAYLVRHYIFTLTVLRRFKKPGNVIFVGDPKYKPPVSILIPARDEENVIGRLLQRMTELTYPRDKLHVIVIDDASSDGTGQIAEEYSRHCEYIKVLHRDKKAGGKGKASALNSGLEHSTGEIVLCFDADYWPQRTIVEKLVKEFADPTVGAVQGRPVVLNEAQNVVTRLVTLERIGGYRVDQEARDNLGLIPQFGGTVGGFRRSVLEKLGGFDESMLTEDTDLTFQVYLAGFKVRYVGGAECYEEAVDNWKGYWRQRNRWARGHMQVCFKHALNVLRSKKLNAKEKIDGLLLLHVYFMPVITLISFFVGVSLILSASSQLVTALWFFVPLSFYSFVGNFAPFFEIGIGAYLDGRTRIQWLIPFLLFVYLYNILNFKNILGVGSGRAFTENLFSKDKFVIASDRSVELVHVAKKHARNTKDFLACDGFTLPFKTQSFECVFSQGLLEHFDLQEAMRLLKEMGRVGETIVFSVPLDKYKGQTLGKEYHRKPEEWLSVLSQIFQFKKMLPYFNKREAVFVASNKPLSKIKRFGEVEVLKRILLTPKPVSKTD